MRLALLSALLVSACVNPQGDIDAFEKRLPKLEAGAGGDAGGDAGGCTVSPGEIEGKFLLVIAVNFLRTKPILAAADVTTPAFGSGTGLAFTAHALSATDRKTPVGPPISAGPFAIDSTGSFHAEIPNLTVTGEANPLTPGAGITASLVLDGNLCAHSRFYCGTADGQATRPITLPLVGSTFTLSPLDASGVPQRPVIDCKGDLADPL